MGPIECSAGAIRMRAGAKGREAPYTVPREFEIVRVDEVRAVVVDPTDERPCIIRTRDVFQSRWDCGNRAARGLAPTCSRVDDSTMS